MDFKIFLHRSFNPKLNESKDKGSFLLRVCRKTDFRENWEMKGTLDRIRYRGYSKASSSSELLLEGLR